MTLTYAAFIMTYERPQIIVRTIEMLLQQTCPPKKIVVVDNSHTLLTQQAIEQLNSSQIQYVRVGKNIGPAGASTIGLQMLASEGYDWIYWGDDDDPPQFANTIESLLNTAQNIPNIGIIGAVGHGFNKQKGRVVRTSDSLLSTNTYLDVDVIAGNMCMLVNAAVVQQKILPNPDFFLNMEEYEYCLRVKNAGFRVGINTAQCLAYRLKNHKYGLPERPPATTPAKSVLWRKYYSTRNLLYLLAHTQPSRLGMLHVGIRAVVKAVVGFKKGYSYGYLNAQMELLGVWHGVTNRMGLIVLPNNKYSL